MTEPTGHPGAPANAAHPGPGAAPAASASRDPATPWWSSATDDAPPVGVAPDAGPGLPAVSPAPTRAPGTPADRPAPTTAEGGLAAGRRRPAPPAQAATFATPYSAPTSAAASAVPAAPSTGGPGRGGTGDLPPVGGSGGSGAGGPERPRLRFRWLRLLLLLVPLGALAVVSTIFGMMMAVSTDLPNLDTAKEFQTAKNSVLLDRSGRQIGVLADSSRYVVSANEISPTMKDAVVSMEDERFYENSGVDVRGIGRAVFQDVVSRRAAQGASTITQQLVKVSLQAEDQRTVFQKLREVALAYHMTKQWSKSKILTTYLNRIYFGNGAYGVESAAKTYFGKTDAHRGCGPPEEGCATTLAPAESALLTAIIASPSRFDPVTEPEAALRRRNTVLLKMRQHGKLSAEDYELAKNEPLPTRDQVEPPTLEAKNPYFASWVSAQLIDRFGAQRTYEGGLKVRTTIDPSMQSAAEKAISSYLSSPGMPTASLVAIDNKTGEVRAMVGGKSYREKPFNLATQGQRQPGSSFKPFVLAQALREGISPQKTYASKKLTLKVKDENGRTEPFRVTNDESAYSGSSTIARALTFSDNAVYAQLGQTVGTKQVARLIRRMGVRSPVSSNAAVALGAPRRGVTVLDMAHAYETFATRGLRINGTLGAPNNGPVGIQEIREPGRRTRVNHRRSDRVLSTGVADTATSIMRTVVSKGTGHRAQYGGFAAGKTGTTENNVDAWFVGFSKDITVAVWVGYPDSGKPMQTQWMGEPVEGGTYPAAIWGTFMGRVEQILDGRDPDRAKKQKGDDDVPVDGAEPDVSSTPTATAPTGATTGDGSSGAGDAASGASGGGTGSTDGSGTTGGTGAGGGGATGGGGADAPATGTPTPPSSGAGSGTGSGGGGSGSGSGAGGAGSTGSGSGAGSGGTGGAVPLG